jgi:hypothetical protein
MHRALLGSALAAAISLGLAAPVSGQAFAAGGFSASSDVRNFTFVAPQSGYGVRVHRGFDRDHHRGGRGMVLPSYGYASGYYDYGDYDANRSFDPDKWNDWWHERPERAFPRWMARNRDCARQWYSGDVLTC